MPENQAASGTGAPETTESEEMYLLTIAMAEEDGNLGPLAMAVLGASLGVSSASANEMVRKLQQRQLLTYQPYRGVELTAQGRIVASRVLRTRRLWSRFLADHLDFTPGEADALACHLEHVTPPDAADRLASYLGDPETGPLGRPIPQAATADAPIAGVPLSTFAAGADVEVMLVIADDVVTGFLATEGIMSGSRLHVLGVGRNTLLVHVGGVPLSLAAFVAAAVLVRPAGDSS